MSGQTNKSGVTGEQIRLLETQLASAFNEEVKLAYAKSYMEYDEYHAPVRVPGSFSYAIKEAHIRAVFSMVLDDPAVMTAVIYLSYNHYRGSNGCELGCAFLDPGKAAWEMVWEKDRS